MNALRAPLGLVLGTGALAIALHGCSQETVEAELRSLQASTQVSFVCRTVEHGVTRGNCPDLENEPQQTVLNALITQTATNEIAIVDVRTAQVVDTDPSMPGYNFLRLPSRPGDIVTTPGGRATFVGLTSGGRTGISVITSDCLGSPRAAELADGIRHAQRDLTTFPACTLSSAPGDIAVLVEPTAADGTIAETCAAPDVPQNVEPPGSQRYSVVPATNAQECAATRTDPNDPRPTPVWIADAAECRQPNGRDCAANLTTEGGPPGRRKLVVALPDEGEIAVLDAQAIVDREPGSFDPCPVEYRFKLQAAADVSGQTQSLPPDLTPAPGCMLASSTPPPIPASSISKPSGLGVSDGRLFVGDLGVPLVHVLDTASVCAIRELPALLPMSFVQPSRIVTTSRVAVTPVTPSGKQFVYAVDAYDQPTSSVMMFDVSDDSTSRTPIVRTGSDRQPREAADRLQFPAPVADIEFALRDLSSSDPATGVAELGTQCDPDPSLSLDPPAPEVQYRSSADRSQGARPRLLRGLFGLVLLTNGQLYVVDVDDFDRLCRRPVPTNASSTPDFRGCQEDPEDISYYTVVTGPDGAPEPGGPRDARTVTAEVSCNMVEPHRTRSEAFGLADASLGIGAPSLRALPHFNEAPYSTGSRTAERPKLLAVPFASPDGGEGVPPELFVGTTLYSTSSENTTLPTVPNADEDTNGLALPLNEPRSYLSNDRNVLTFEGRVVGADFPSGFFDLSALSADTPGVVNDPAAFYCGNGIYDVAMMANYAEEVLGLSAAESLRFAEGPADAPQLGHADYVQITGDFPSLVDPYWQSVRGLADGGGRAECLEAFGPPPGQSQDLQTSRDFRILEAYQDRLVIRPRQEQSPERLAELVRLVGYCFPSGVRYTVRSSNQWTLANGTPGWLVDTVVDSANGNRCVRDCNPRKRWFKKRLFEIASTDVCGPDGTAESCAISGVGPGTASDGPCRYDPIVAGPPPAEGATPLAVRGITLEEPGGADRCIFENLTSRFVVYRGQKPSVRDMSFTWDQTGGFYPLTASLTLVSRMVMPQNLEYVPELEAIAVVDAASLGLSLMTLDSLVIQEPWPVF